MSQARIAGVILLFALATACAQGASTEDPGTGGSTTSGQGGAGATMATGSGGTTAGVGGSSAGAGGARTGAGGASATGGRSGTGGVTTGAGGASAGVGGTTGGAGGPGAGGATGEDDGAGCNVAALPDASALPTVAKLPDPFKKLDGTAMTSKAEWRCRRQEIKALAEKFVYGSKPAKPTSVTGTVTGTSITVNVMNAGKSTTFNASIVRPTSGTAPYPAIIVYAGGGFGAPLDSAVVNSEGVALINYDPYQVGQEGTGRTTKRGAFYDIYGSNSTTGLLVAWGWGVSRIVDLIEQSGGSVIRPDAIAVTGCSRFGKGAFAAGVFDQRIPLTMPIESGSGGVPIYRGLAGEGAQTASSAYGEQPWLGDGFNPFTGTGAQTRLPVDTHELVALVAPRGLFIMDNPFIANLGPRSAHVAALGGAEVYRALGVGANLSYISAISNGTHCAQRPEWSQPLRDHIQKYLKKTGSAAGAIRAQSSATGNLTDWRDWTTPALN